MWRLNAELLEYQKGNAVLSGSSCDTSRNSSFSEAAVEEDSSAQTTLPGSPQSSAMSMMEKNLMTREQIADMARAATAKLRGLNFDHLWGPSSKQSRQGEDGHPEKSCFISTTATSHDASSVTFTAVDPPPETIESVAPSDDHLLVRDEEGKASGMR